VHRRLNLFFLPPPTRLVHRSRYSSGTVLEYIQQQRKPPMVGRHDEVKIQFASSILAELAAGNWGWVYRVGLAGTDAAAGLGLEKLTAQPPHLVKLREILNRRKAEEEKRKYKKRPLSSPLNHNMLQRSTKWVESHRPSITYHSRAATDERRSPSCQCLMLRV